MNQLTDVVLCKDVGSFCFKIKNNKYKAQYPDFYIWCYYKNEIVKDVRELTDIYENIKNYTKYNPYLIIRCKKIKEKLLEFKNGKEPKEKKISLYYNDIDNNEVKLGSINAIDINDAIYKLIKKSKNDFTLKTIKNNTIFEKNSV